MRPLRQGQRFKSTVYISTFEMPLYAQYITSLNPFYSLASPVSTDVGIISIRTSLKAGLSLVFSSLKIMLSLEVTKHPICRNLSKAKMRSSSDREIEQSATTCTSNPNDRKSMDVCSTQTCVYKKSILINDQSTIQPCNLPQCQIKPHSAAVRCHTAP